MPINEADVKLTYTTSNTPPASPDTNTIYFCNGSKTMWVGNTQYGLLELSKSATNSFTDGIDSLFKSVKANIQPVQVGSGTPSPTNVRAINGFTECTVTDTNGTDTNTATIQLGENLLNITATTQTINNVTFTVNGGTVSVSSSGSASATTQLILGEITLQAGTTYTLKGCPSGGSGSTYALYIRGTTGFTQVVDNGVGVTFTPSANVTTDVRIIVYSGANVSNVIFNPKIIKPVYSGTVDLTSGTLTVDRGYLQPTTVVDVATSGGKVYWIVANNLTSINGVNGLISSHFEPASGVVEGHCYITGNGVILVAVPTDQTLNTKALADAWLSTNQPQFVYKLATPQTCQLTPTQLRSLVGTNNLTSNTGDTVEVEYITNETIAWLLDNTVRN